MNRTVWALIAVAVVVFAVVLAARLGRPQKDGGPPAGNVTPPPGTATVVAGNVEPPPTFQGPVKRLIECGKPVRLEDTEPRTGQKIMLLRTVALGEQADVLEIPDDWQKTLGYDDEKTKSTPGAMPGKAYYEFDLPRAGTYYLFVRAQWKDKCGNSVYLKLNDLPYDGIKDTEGQVAERQFDWCWHPVLEPGKGVPKGFRLKAGKNNLVLATREDGPTFHRILVSTDANTPAKDEVNP